MHRAILFLALFAPPLVGQVVVVAPPPPLNPELTISDPYGACLPDPMRHTGSAPRCIPNPYWKPDFTTATLNYGSPYVGPYAPQSAAPGAAPALAAPTPRPFSALEIEAARLAAQRERAIAEGVYGTQLRQAAMDQLGAALKAQQEASAKYRAAWPVWAAHWDQVRGRLVEYATALQDNATPAQIDRACGAYIGAMNETQIALPPAPDYQLVDLHKAVYESRTACEASPRDAALIKVRAAAMVTAVRVTDEWAAGRGAYYAASAAQR